MVRVTDKKKNIFKEWWEAFQKSRPAQLAVFVLVIVVLIAWYFLAQHSAAVEAQQKIEEQRKAADALVAEQKTQIISSITSLFHFVTVPSGKQSVVLAMKGDTVPDNLRDELASCTQTLLSTKYPASVVLSDVVLPEFYSTGYFDKAFGGDLGFLDTAQFFQHENVLLLIQPQIEFKDATAPAVADAGMKSCHISLLCRAYTSTHTPCREVRLDEVGAGHSDELSFKAAFAALQQDSHADSILAP